jgi:hypothetical protein
MHRLRWIFCHVTVVSLGLVLLVHGNTAPAPVDPLHQANLFQPHVQRQSLVQQHFQHGITQARAGLLQEAIGHFKYCSGWAALFCDYDADGDLNLLVTRDGWRGVAPNSLYRNNGDGTFTDVAPQAGVANHGRSIGSAFGDYDNDGWLDIFATGWTENMQEVLQITEGDNTLHKAGP